MLAAHHEAANREKRIIEDERNLAREECEGNEDSNVIIMPTYILDERLKVDRET